MRVNIISKYTRHTSIHISNTNRGKNFKRATIKARGFLQMENKVVDQFVATSSKLFPVWRTHLPLRTNRYRKYRVTICTVGH